VIDTGNSDFLAPVIATRFSPSIAIEGDSQGDSDLDKPEHPSPHGRRHHSNCFFTGFNSSELPTRDEAHNPLPPYYSGRRPSEWPTVEQIAKDGEKPPNISSTPHGAHPSDVDQYTPGQVHLPIPRARVLPSYVQEPIPVAPPLSFQSILIHLQRFLPFLKRRRRMSTTR
jgi:hypothetical protein